MSMRTLGALAVTAACALASPAWAQDQETGAVSVSASASGPRASSSRSGSRHAGKLRINAGLHFGGGGEWELDSEGPGGFEDDLDPLVGLQEGVDYVLMEYFALGGEMRMTWWRPDDDEFLGEVDRSMFFDLNIKPRGRYEFDRIPLEVYGTLPMGLSVAAMNDDTGLDTGAGFNLGFGGGATYFITSRIGVNAEMLGVWHWFDADTDAADIDTDNRTAQFYFLLNAVFAL